MDLFSLLKETINWSSPLILKRGDYLCEPPRKDQNIYWVKEGLLRIFTVEEEQDYGVRFGYEGDLISVLDSYIKGEPSRFSVQALRKTTLVSCSKEAFENRLKQYPELRDLWMEGLYQLIYDMLEREQDLMIADPRQRLQRVLGRSHRLFQEVPHKYIASYLRMSPETLSRLLNS